jgi:beta-phosphoglucomutase-like phosphatase (HAD superfamily)
MSARTYKNIDWDLMLKALIFDVDGTLADTESAHRAAFNHAFVEEGLDWVWDEALYIELLDISGGKERIAHYWKQTRGDIVGIEAHSLQDTIARLHELKTAAYEGMVNDGMVSLRPGVLRLIESAQEQGLALAIACAPIAEFAPAMFSIINCAPNTFSSSGAESRANESAPPPGA